MELNEIKNAIENNYKIVCAAIKVNEANAAYEAAEKAHEEIEYDYTHLTSNDEWMRRLDIARRAEGNLKKAVNAFFKTVGEKTQKFDLGFSAKLAFNKWIDEHSGYYCKSPLAEINIYSLKCR